MKDAGKETKVLKEKLSKYQEETNHISTDLRNQLQEAKKSEGDLVVLLRKRIQDSENFRNKLLDLEKGLMKNLSNISLKKTQKFWMTF